MTASEQNIAIAMACNGGSLPRPNARGEIPIADYVNDLNAMHEAEKFITRDESYDYMVDLSHRVYAEEPTSGTILGICGSTAAQRAGAFLRVKGLWK